MTKCNFSFVVITLDTFNSLQVLKRFLSLLVKTLVFSSEIKHGWHVDLAKVKMAYFCNEITQVVQRSFPMMSIVANVAIYCAIFFIESLMCADYDLEAIFDADADDRKSTFLLCTKVHGSLKLGLPILR